MEIYVTPEGQIRTSLSFPSYLNLTSSFLKTKRDTLEKLDIFFVNGTDVSRKAVGTNVVVTVKPLSQWDADAVFVGDTAEYPATDDDPYSVDLAISSSSIDTSLFVDSDSGNDVEYVDFMLEIAYSESGGGFSALDWRKSDNVLFRVYNDVNRNDAIPKSPAFGHVLVEAVKSNGVLYVTGDPDSGGTITIGGNIITYTIDGGPSYGSNSIDANSGNATINVATFCTAVKQFINNEESTQVGWTFRSRNFNAPVTATNTTNAVEVEASEGGVIGDTIATLENLTNATWTAVTLLGGADTVYATKDNWVSDYPQSRDLNSQLQARLNIGAASEEDLASLADAKDLEPMDTSRAYEVGEAFYWIDDNNYRTNVASDIGVTPDTNPENFSILGVRSSIYTSDGILTGDREIDLGGNSIHFTNGTNFTIDGAVFTSDSVEPTSVEFGSIQIDADVDNDSLFLTDGSDSGFTAGTLCYKNSLGAYSNMEQASMTGADIKIAYEGESNTNAFTDTEKTKLATIQSNANVNVNPDWNGSGDDSEILNKPTLGTAAQSAVGDFATSTQGDLADTLSTTKQDILTEGAFVDGDKTKLDAITGTNTGDQDLSGLQSIPAEGAFVDGDKTKLDSALQPADPTLDSVTDNGATTTNNITVGGMFATGNNVASGTTSIAIGGTNNSATGHACEVLGSDGSLASGTGSTVIGGSNHTNSGNWSASVGGLNQTLSSVRSGIFAGFGNTLQHNDSSIVNCVNRTSVATNTLHTENVHLFGGFKMPTGASDTYVLTSDANGVGTWQAASGGGGGGTVQNANLSIQPTDEGTSAGNARGSRSVDLQTNRSAATQVASGISSVVAGGQFNTASGYAYTTVSGGVQNTASQFASTVSGGKDNTASGYASFVGGGYNNTVTASEGTVSGGRNNTSSGIGGSSTVVGGWQCTASGSYGDICGGYMSTSSGYSSVAFGDTGQAQGNFSVVSGGRNNTASGTYSAVLGGASNDTNSQSKAMIVGSNITATDANTLHCNNLKIENGGFKLPTGATNGYVLTTDATGVGTWQAAGGGGGGGGTVQNVNLSIEPTDEGTTAGNARGANAVDLQSFRLGATQTASGKYAVIAGGSANTASGQSSVVGGGSSNTASGASSAIGGGINNAATFGTCTIAGGQNNIASYYNATVGGGQGNTNSGYYGVIAGGWSNTASGYYSVISGGYDNTATGYASAVLGGISNNTNSQSNAMIVGSNITADRTNCTFVSNLSIKSIPTSATGLPSGSVWSDGGTLKIV